MRAGVGRVASGVSVAETVGGRWSAVGSGVGVGEGSVGAGVGETGVAEGAKGGRAVTARVGNGPA